MLVLYLTTPHLLLGPPRFAHPWTIGWSFVSSFVGILVVAILSQYGFQNFSSLYTSFGATAVLLYAAPTSPLGISHTHTPTLSLALSVCLNDTHTDSLPLPSQWHIAIVRSSGQTLIGN
jgi:hypothetical protein